MAKNKGEEYECDECGLVVLVQNPCECSDECQIMCCEKPMKQVKSASKSSVPKTTEKPKK